MAALLAAFGGARGAGAQVPATRADSVRAGSVRADSIRAARADSVRTDSIRRRTVADSAGRDSLVAAQMRQSARRARPSLFEQLNFDKLRLTEIGGAVGLAFPDQVERAPLYAVHADYGEILPRLRAVVGVTYWRSRYTDDAVDEFTRALRTAVHAPVPPDSIVVGRVGSQDVALTAETRWRPGILGGSRAAGLFQPWVALGVGVHLVDIQGGPIAGTFVERAIDGISFGTTTALGVDVALLREIKLSAEARYDLFNGARYGSLRAGASYVFEPRRGASR